MRPATRYTLKSFLAVIFVALVASSALAQSSGVAPANLSTYRPNGEIGRIERSLAPTIDGNLSDQAWRHAMIITDFYQVEPNIGAPPSEETIAYLLHDEKNLYFGIHVKYRDPEIITANIMRRDGPIARDDEVRLLLDSYDTGRDSFFFTFNALGARWDGLVENNRNITGEWNTIWRVRTKRVADGWTAEVEIPFQSISFDQNAEAWGLQITRKITQTNEKIRWATIDQSRDDWDMSNAGRLSGIGTVNNGRGLDVQAFTVGRWTRNWEQPREDDFGLEASGNVYYKITPSLTGTLTLNTDFSDTPLDARQVNTSRFSLFFPESRDFFLQDQAIFAFGGRGLREVNGQPFFSRRIGIVNGETVDILAGAKLSGSLGRYNVGALTTRTRATDTLDAQQLSIVRGSAEVLGESRIGFIATNGDPTGATNNSVTGADFLYRNSNFFGRGGQFVADFFVLRSFSDDSTDRGNSFGFEAAYPNDRWSWRTGFKQVDDGYDPKLGFTNRENIRLYNGSLRRRWRPSDSILRHINVGSWWDFTTDLTNELESRQNGFWTGVVTQAGDDLFFNVWNSFELIRSPFQLPNNITVNSGKYSWTRGNIFIDTSSNRKVSLQFEFACCDWFDGTRRDYKMELNLQPIRYFDLGWEHDISEISLPTGAVTIHVSKLDFSLNFSPDMQLTNQLQYDNISQGLTYFGRFQWEIRPQTEIFVALSHGAITDFEDFRSIQSGSVIRIGNTFRF